MLVPKRSIPWSAGLRSTLSLLVVALSLNVRLAAARGPEPPLRIPLDTLGFQPLSSQFLLAGSSMLTLHYVDEQHLLLTFSARHLLKRLPDEPEDDMDRNIDAVLIELPTGKVLARTTWRVHDHGQYLWSLGHGQFLLRVRDTLTTFAPLANLSSENPFVQHPFLNVESRRIAAILVSPDADLLTIETVRRTPPTPKPKTPLFGPTPAPTPEPVHPGGVQINFYRLHPSPDGSIIRPAVAGFARSNNTGTLATTTAGYLVVVDQGHQHYAFDFHSYSGRVDELAPFDSACVPFPLFVSHSEFIAFGCRTGQTLGAVGGFNMRGQEMWEQGLFGDYIAPSLSYATSSGRFAFSRILLRSSAMPDEPVSSDQVGAQSIVVYQTDSGKQILHAECSPVERAGQNFTLSPDGLALALVHADAIEIYRLPPLTPKEENAVKLAVSSAPPETDLPVKFDTQLTPSAEEADSTVQPEAQPTNTISPAAPPQPATGQIDNNPTPALTQQQSADAPPAQALGDPLPEEHRARPTLYTLPTDHPPDHSKDNPQ
jgi:hypothetical protein